MTTHTRFFYGGLGGVAYFVVDFGSFLGYASLADVSVVYLVGVVIRLLFFVIVGGLWAWFNKIESPIIAFQIGIVPVALIYSLISAGPVVTQQDTQVSSGGIELAVVTSTIGMEEKAFFYAANRGGGQEEIRERSPTVLDGLRGSPVIHDQAAPSAPARDFLYVFFAVIGLTVFAGLGGIVLTQKAGPSPPKMTEAVIERLMTTWTLGCGAAIGLLGGQTL